MKKYYLSAIIVCFFSVSYGQNTFPASGNVGIGTTNPTASLSFKNAYTNSDPTGITWYTESPLIYGIYRTAGEWNSPNYQQLKLSWDTGIILDPGKEYGKSYVEIPNGGLRVSSGNVGIGTIDTKGYKLAVAGNMIAESIKVQLQSSWPDYVFAKEYQLPSLAETEKHIQEKGHLSGIPSATEAEANGIDLGEMNKELLKKIEELTLHLIEQNKLIDTCNKKMDAQDKRIQSLEISKGTKKR